MNTRGLRRLFFTVMVLTYLAAPAFAQDPKSIVERQRAQYGPTISPAEAPTLLKEIAADLGATLGQPFGLLLKTSGNNCGGYACDIICDATNHYDVFNDGPDASQNYSGKAIAQWLLKGPVPRACELVAANPTPQPPTSPTPSAFDPTPLLQRLDALEHVLNTVQTAFGQRLEALEAAASVDAKAINDIKNQNAVRDNAVENIRSRQQVMSCSASIAGIPIHCALNK